MSCTVDGCEKRQKSRGMCGMHASRLARTGTTDPRPRVIRTGPPSRQKPDYRQLTLHGHPLANCQGTVAVHRLVLWNRVGSAEQQCHWCSRPLTWFDAPRAARVIADHIDGDRLNNDPSNVVAACNHCNIARNRPDYLTHCPHGHERSGENSRIRPDGSLACRPCDRIRARKATS